MVTLASHEYEYFSTTSIYFGSKKYFAKGKERIHVITDYRGFFVTSLPLFLCGIIFLASVLLLLSNDKTKKNPESKISADWIQVRMIYK